MDKLQRASRARKSEIILTLTDQITTTRGAGPVLYYVLMSAEPRNLHFICSHKTFLNLRDKSLWAGVGTHNSSSTLAFI